jgi:pimeloyl-ACP methyl ester carboxylesterase
MSPVKPSRGMTDATLSGTLRRPDGVTIAYDVIGKGPPVVFLHGLMASRKRWDPVTDLLASDLSCARVDLRGHGESSPAADYSMPSRVGDVRAVVDELALGASDGLSPRKPSCARRRPPRSA